MKKYNKFCFYVSSRNNYDMLSGEVFPHINIDDCYFINIDDASSEKEVSKGRQMCKDRNVPFIKNHQRGLQWAAKTAAEYVVNNYPTVEWIIHFQHDNYPMYPDFYDKLTKYIESGFINDFGTIGFNVLDKDKRTTGNLYKQKARHGIDVIGTVGVAVLAKSPKNYYNGHHYEMKWENWKDPFAVDSVMWCCLGINVDKMIHDIDVTDEYNLHLWGADLCMQFGKINKYNVVLPDLYVTNHMEVKTKYGLNSNSAKGAKRGDDFHFGHYDHFPVWEKRWGWDWNDRETFSKVSGRYEGTLLPDFFAWDVEKGSIKTFKTGW